MDTKQETIKQYNTSKTVAKDTTTPAAHDALATNQDKIKQKAEEQPKTPQQIAEEQKQLEEQQKQQELDSVRQLTQQVQEIQNRVNNTVNPIKNWIASQPTPGGIAALVVFILFMTLVMIPVNDQGHTRMYLFFQTLIGRTHMQYRENTAPGQGSTVNVPSENQGGSQGNGPGYNDIMQPIDITHLNLFGGL